MVKRVIKRVSPLFLIELYRKWTYNKYRSEHYGISPYYVFHSLYERRKRSRGSESEKQAIPKFTKRKKALIKGIQDILQKYEIKKLFHVPCGDFGLMKHVDLEGVKYLGVDLVDDIIERNIKYYSDDNKDFMKLDLTSETIHKSDLVFSRDSLGYLSFSDLHYSLENIKRSDSTYLLTTTFRKHRLNYDTATGDYRPINFRKKPFNFPKPLLILKEDNQGLSPEYRDRCLALWKISDINLPSQQYNL